mmetsp:Transcript_29467/g.40491  ORF Transcript_29467/g.40491 Transcript_29467/m.40491 type:complete len:324 (+) Transcript_29467:23-994(+)
MSKGQAKQFKSDRYSAKDDTDELELITDKLALDLRKSIRQLEIFPILSEAWFQMAETFVRIASISEMESKLPAAKKDATLWETEEQALRFILEDGKLNLCLRCLVDFKQQQIASRKSLNGPMMEYTTECDKFEKSIGSIMRNAWQHVEALQTTDLPALLLHIHDVLTATLEMPEYISSLIKKGDLYYRQEILIFYYLNGIFKHMEDVREHRVMPIVRERGIFMLLIRVLNQFCNPIEGSILKLHRLKAADTLSLLVETEDFNTHRSSYYNQSGLGGDIDAMVELKECCLKDLLTDMDSRKMIRPLVDCIDRAKRQMKSLALKK